MSKSTIRREVRILKEALAPQNEPEWKRRAEEIDKVLREYEAVMEQIKKLSPREQGEILAEEPKIIASMPEFKDQPGINEWALAEAARLNLLAQKAEVNGE